MMEPLKLLFPIRRRDGVTHDQLVDYWRRVHMPAVVAHLTPQRYAVTFFEQRRSTSVDGMASVTYHDHQRGRFEQGRNMPAAVAQDGFGDLIERANRIEGTEHVIVDGPRPAHAHKVTGLVRARPGVGLAEVWDVWLRLHAPNVAARFEQAGGLRYQVTLADQHRGDPFYAGAAELYFVDADCARAHLGSVAHDPFMDLTTSELCFGTEVVGIG